MPRHGGMPLMVPHPRDERQPDHDAARRVLLWSAVRRDSGFQNMREGPPERVRSGCATLFSALPRTGGRAPEGGRRSWFVWFSYICGSYSVRLVLIILPVKRLSRQHHSVASRGNNDGAGHHFDCPFDHSHFARLRQWRELWRSVLP